MDDNEVNRRVLHEQIASWGMRNGSFAGGEEALQALREAQAGGDKARIKTLLPRDRLLRAFVFLVDKR